MSDKVHEFAMGLLYVVFLCALAYVTVLFLEFAVHIIKSFLYAIM